MFDWLVTLPQWFQILFISSMGIVFWAIVWKLSKKGFSLVYGKFSLSSGKKEQINPHTRCQHVKDIFYMLLEQQSIINKKTEIKVSTLPRQMDYAEERFVCILGDMQDIYIKLLQESGEEHPTDTDSFKIYLMVLELLKVKILFKIRTVLQRNKLSEMTEEEFSRYAKDKLDMLITEIFDYITDKYFCNRVIPKETLYNANSEYLDEMKSIISEIIMKARSTSTENHKRIEELDTNLGKMIEECIGKNHRFF